MITLIIAMFVINAQGFLSFDHYEVFETNSMKECRIQGEEYPIPEGIDAVTYLCVERE